eukprot:GFYU01019927.1.p1 GENE.GFYU01019927.1~~GFYU01019927.1.p1  ORF type:complete len:330 (+),score=108.41 GFYU01019927.1:73-990(+)
MMTIAIELAQFNKSYEDVATKFFEHFVHIANAINNLGGKGGLWDDEDGFFYDALKTNEGTTKLRVRSFVGLIPLFAVEVLSKDTLAALPGFRARIDWFAKYRPHLLDVFPSVHENNDGNRLLALVSREKLVRILRHALDDNEFLSDYGLRSMSAHHRDNPYHFMGQVVKYEPAESSSPMFGGNSNWRGPVWFPVNYLLIESLQKFDMYYSDSLKVPMPTNNGPLMTLDQVASELSQRMTHLFTDRGGKRACFGGVDLFQQDPHWRDNLLFYEFFHGDNGAGIGASHQTGWTGLVAKLLQQEGARR